MRSIADRSGRLVIVAGGPAAYRTRQIQVLQEQGPFEGVSVLYLNEFTGHPKIYESVGIDQHWLPQGRSSLRAAGLVRRVRSLRPSHVLLCGYARPELVVLALVLRCIGVPFSLFSDSNIFTTRRRARGFVRRIAVRLVAGLAETVRPVGRAGAAYYVANGLSLESIGPFLPHLASPDLVGSDTRSEDRSDSASAAAAPAALTAGYVGRLAPEKRLDVILEAYERADLPVGSRLVVVGGLRSVSGWNDEVAGMIEQMSRPVERREFMLGTHYADALRSLDVLVVASDAEPWGAVVLDALSVGVPVIAPWSCGSAEMIVEGVTGFLFRPGDPSSLAEALESYAGHEDRAFLSAASRLAYRHHARRWSPSRGWISELEKQDRTEVTERR